MSELPDLLSEASIKQTAKDREYRKEYEAWVATLSESEIAKMKEAGLHEPALAGGSGGMETVDNFMPCPKSSAWHPGLPVDDFQHSDEEEIEYDKDDLTKLGEINPETLTTIIRVLLCPSFAKQGLRPIWYRAVVLAHCLHVRGIGERSLSDLAREMNVSRALLSNFAVRLRDFAKLDCRAGKSFSARAAMSERRLWRSSRQANPNFKEGKAKRDNKPGQLTEAELTSD